MRQRYGVLADPPVRSSSSCPESRTSHNYLRLDKMICERLRRFRDLMIIRNNILNNIRNTVIYNTIYDIFCVQFKRNKNRSPDILQNCQLSSPNLPVLGATGWYSRVYACWNDEAGRLPKVSRLCRGNLHFGKHFEQFNFNWRLKCWSTNMERRHCTSTYLCMHGVKVIRM